MAEFLSNTGVKVVINVAPWGDALALKNSIVKELKSADLSKVLETSEDVSVSKLIGCIIGIDCSEEVQANLMKCLIRCTYKGEKITDDTFEDEAARTDYYDIVFKCLEVNLSPFFKGLASRLNGIVGLISPSTNIPK